MLVGCCRGYMLVGVLRGVCVGRGSVEGICW